LEAFLAMEIESRFTKDQILELYMNRVYFGAGFYGVQAAARGYFGKPAKDLNLSECATLVGLLKNPNRLSPWSNREASLENRNYVLGRMCELRMISEALYQQTAAADLAVKNRRPVRAESYAFDLIRQQAVARLGLDEAFSEGYKIFTTVDPALQQAAESSLIQRLERIENRPGYDHETYAAYSGALGAHDRTGGEDEFRPPNYLQGAVVVIDNRTGGFLALAGGRDFAHSQYNRALLAARPAGTAFKPLVFAAAFEKGLFPGTLVEDAAIDNRQVMIGGTTGVLGEWGPERDDNRYEGQIPARQVLVKSKNAATVRLGMQTGIETVNAFAQRAGIRSELRKFPNTLLGSSEVTLDDLTLAFSIFPGGGSRPSESYIIDRIDDAEGRTVFRASPGRKNVCDAGVAHEVHACLSEVLESGTAHQAFAQMGLRRFPAAGKTGTAYNFTDCWFLGYSSAITCGVWAGFDKPQTIYRGAFSNQVALPIWIDVMNASFGAYPAKPLDPPAGLSKVEICLASGQLATPKCAEPQTNLATGEAVSSKGTVLEWATASQKPKSACPVHGEPVPGPAGSAPLSPEAGEWPRAQIAADLSQIKPVFMKAPTVVGEDPYESVRPTTVLPAVRVDTGELPTGSGETANEPGAAPVNGRPAETEVRRAEPARALEGQPLQENPIKLEAPAPLQF
jgi:penicillin-binding protein 1A